MLKRAGRQDFLRKPKVRNHPFDAGHVLRNNAYRVAFVRADDGTPEMYGPIFHDDILSWKRSYLAVHGSKHALTK